MVVEEIGSSDRCLHVVKIAEGHLRISIDEGLLIDPAATGGLLPLESSGYLLGSSVVPEFRKKGIYRALLRHRLEILKQRNIQYASIFAMEQTSAPVCKKLGFETICHKRLAQGLLPAPINYQKIRPPHGGLFTDSRFFR